MVRLVDPKDEDTNGEKSGLLLYNNKTMCSEGFTIDLSRAICRLLGFSDSSKWTAVKYEGRYEMSTDSLECTILEGEIVCILHEIYYSDCKAESAVFLFCAGKL